MTQLQISSILNSVFFKQTSFFWYTILASDSVDLKADVLVDPGTEEKTALKFPFLLFYSVSALFVLFSTEHVVAHYLSLRLSTCT